MAKDWTPEADARLTELHAQGLGNPAIAREMGRTVGSIKTRLTRLRARGVLVGKRSQGGARPLREGEIPCLCCQQPFKSAGKHNRLCSRCKLGNSPSVFDMPSGDGCRNVVMGG